eukprot:TRINITY_DN5025_c0_g1_i1.p1 TRINITY_DN5025_c0_g1~~TRINITY_DN5025_c0_g1_i1.p1  ORF type:complete len:918 (+),score=220.33 TRINITY_DN5025_c0_g1_i1:175-2928(+)
MQRFNSSGFVIIPLLALLCAALVQGQPSYYNCVYLDGHSNMRLSWNLTGTEILGSIEGNIGDGWMAFGIALGSEFYMTSDGQGTDAIVGAMRDDGTCNNGCIRDYWIYDYVAPRLDTSQDVQLVGANRTGNHVTLHFRRLLSTPDTTEDRAINTTLQRINWAYNTNRDAMNSNGILMQRHVNQGTLLLNLTAPSQCTNIQTQNTAFSNHDGSYRASWVIDETAGTITITAKAKTKGWVAFGINTKPGMIGGDVIVGWIGPNNSTVVHDRTAVKEEMPVLDTSLSNGADDVTNAQAYTEVIGGATFTVITFTRQLVTDDPNDVALIDGEGTPTYLMWAYGSDNSVNGDRFDRHVDAGSEQLNFFDGCIAAPRLLGYALEKTHGMLMVIGWFCFLPIGMFASRYMKTMTPRWFPTHVALQTIGVAIIIVSFIIIVVDHGGRIHVGAHQIIGVIVFGLTLSMPILGIISDKMFDPKRKSAPVFPDQIHWWVGRLTFLIAIVNVFLGIWMFSVYSFLLWIFATAWVILSLIVLIVQERRVGQTHEQGYNEMEVKGDSESSAASSPAVSKRTFTKKERKNNMTTFIVYIVLSAGLVLALCVVLGINQPSGPRLFDTEGQLCMRFDKYEVQPVETAYICRGFMFPQDRPYHVLKFEPILENPAYVHHMILYSVPEYVDKEYFPCGESPPGAFPLYAWAVGMDPFETPENVGFRVGQNAVTQYIVLEIHYNNPEKTKGIVDSSGVRMTMTADLRPIDAGIFVLGVDTGSINIPGNSDVFELTSTCSAKQTGSLPPANKINALVDDYIVFSSGLHMHQHGRQIYTEQIRDNKKIGDVGCNDYFDFQRQKFTPVNVTLKPGDQFVTHCVWNTTGTAQKVKGCESTSCEMCLNYIAYYPQIPGGGGGCVGKPTVVDNPVRRQNCAAN